ncbi:MAG: hypothetical protein AB7P07_05255 [Hyphomonadaceae bacterium]
MSPSFLRASSSASLRAWGAALAVASVILPALPFGMLFAQPPMPLAVLWAAYGWAAEDESGWRAPVALTLLGLTHDLLAGGPFGLFMAIYLSAYLIGRGVAVLMSAPNLLSLWGGFAVTAVLSIVVARLLAPWALGPNVSVRPYAEAALITAVLFPLVRPLYMTGGPAARAQGARR